MTTILGILNITDDSFFDGGKYLDPAAAIAQGRALAADGAHVLDIGAASSNPDSRGVPPEKEIARLEAVLPALSGIPLSIDTFSLPVQRWALAQNVAYLNDIEGFADAALYPDLAVSSAKLIVMHSVQRRGAATRVHVPPSEIMDRIVHFFDARLAVLEAAGVTRDRLILDPGMGFFLGTDPETSFTVLRRLPELAARYGLPLLVSVSRKSFLRAVTGRHAAEAGPASLAAELFAIHRGANFIRTHTPAALRDALMLEKALRG
ncbi:MAG: dihydropteroate synthase [Alphaproteobacteria bacterium]|nr:dihydropteroate synthase [Alphaproteobacteria bacterium]MBL7097391.1 dihydropteroate synthase [Alphaproteobacteria bacterium]